MNRDRACGTSLMSALGREWQKILVSKHSNIVYVEWLQIDDFSRSSLLLETLSAHKKCSLIDPEVGVRRAPRGSLVRPLRPPAPVRRPTTQRTVKSRNERKCTTYRCFQWPWDYIVTTTAANFWINKKSTTKSRGILRSRRHTPFFTWLDSVLFPYRL